MQKMRRALNSRSQNRHHDEKVFLKKQKNGRGTINKRELLKSENKA